MRKCIAIVLLISVSTFAFADNTAKLQAELDYLNRWVLALRIATLGGIIVGGVGGLLMGSGVRDLQTPGAVVAIVGFTVSSVGLLNPSYWLFPDAERTRLLNAIHIQGDPNVDQRTKDAIANKQIRIGMSREHLLLSRGQPERINKSVYSWGVLEQFVYGGGRYVYLKNGRVTSTSS